MIVRLSAALVRLVEHHAERAWPEECCGLLIGQADGEIVTVTGVVASPNGADDPRTGFEIDPRLIIAAQRQARDHPHGHGLVGHYHSHPNGPAVPSARDAEARHYDDHLWLIAAVSGGAVVDLTAWKPAPADPPFMPAAIEKAP